MLKTLAKGSSRRGKLPLRWFWHLLSRNRLHRCRRDSTNEDQLEEALDQARDEAVESIDRSIEEIEEAPMGCRRDQEDLKTMATWFGPAAQRSYALKAYKAGKQLDKLIVAFDRVWELEDTRLELQLMSLSPSVPSAGADSVNSGAGDHPIDMS